MIAKRAAIIGAGPMGLMCAMELLKQGTHVDIYDRDDRIGGMSATFNFDGLEIERYYHFICKTDYSLFALLDELKIADALRWQDTKMGFYYQGKLYRWGTPFALLGFDGLDFISKIRYAFHVLCTKRITDWTALDNVNAVSWLKKWLGERGYNALWRSLFELKFYEYTGYLSAAWIGTRIKRVALSRKSLFQESLGYLEGGSATLLKAMERFILERGGNIYLKAGIEQVICGDDGQVRGVIVDGIEHPHDQVLSTIPIQYVPRLVPNLPDDFKARIQAIENIAVACVILKLDRPFSNNFWMNINDSDIKIPGLIEYSNLNQVGPSIVYAPFYMPKTNPKYAHPDDELIDEVINYMGRINPAFRPNWIIGQHLHRYEFAQTICPPGFYSKLPPMQTPIEGFFMADTSYYYPEDRSISESVRVAKLLVAAASRLSHRI